MFVRPVRGPASQARLAPDGVSRDRVVHLVAIFDVNGGPALFEHDVRIHERAMGTVDGDSCESRVKFMLGLGLWIGLGLLVLWNLYLC